MSTDSVGSPRTSRGAVLIGLLAGLVVWARAPFGPRNFWAEDGARFFAHALEDGWFAPLGESVAGYFHLLPRLLGTLGTLVPIEWAPAIVFVGGASVVGWFAGTIWLADRSIGSGWFLAGLAVSPVLLAITGFESIGNIANLHFLMLCATAVVLVGVQDGTARQVNDALLAAMAGLTSPIALGLAPLAVARWWSDRREGGRPAPVICGWAVGLVVQFVMMATLVDDARQMDPDRSVTKIGFLFLERVVAYNVLPFWPRISGADASSVTGELVVRALVSLMVVAVVGLGLLATWSRWHRAGLDRRALVLLAVPVTGVGFFLAASWMVGSEPRYAVFPAFCLVWTLLMLTEGRRVGRLVVLVVVMAAVLTHWVPSDLRRTGPTWSDGLERAREACHLDVNARTAVPILPEGWSVTLGCDDLG